MDGHGDPHQAASEGGYPAVEAYHSPTARTGRVDAGAEELILAYDDPDTGMIKAHKQQE